MLMRTVLLFLLFAAVKANADVISALEVQSVQFVGTQNTNLVSDGVVGWTFTATESFTISSLGYYDHGQDGLVDSHDVGVWRISGGPPSLLATAAIPSGTTANLNGQFRYTQIAPLQIATGNDYVIGATIGFGVGVAQYDPTVTPTASGWSVVSKISNVAGRFGLVFPAGSGFDDFNFPSDFGGASDPPIAGPNFLISVPEPSSFLLYASSLIGIAASSRRRRTVHSSERIGN